MLYDRCVSLRCDLHGQGPAGIQDADEAASALVGAAKSDDLKAIVAVLGPDGEDIVSSGDQVADAATRTKFVAAYDARHTIAMEGDNKAVMVIGPEDLHFRSRSFEKTDNGGSTPPRDGTRFCSPYWAKRLDAIQSILAYVDAQDEYAEKDRTGDGANTYARRIISQPGKRDGLYWPTSQSEAPSPLGELIARAMAQGYRTSDGRTPFHGYYFKILTKQGPAATGGELDYVVNGKMIGGFGLVPIPPNTELGRDDVHFQSCRHCFQKDLGPSTAQLAERMTAYNPDTSWQDVADTKPLR